MIWLPVVDYPNYEVSEYGDVRSKATSKLLKPDWGGRSRLRYRYIRLFKDGKCFHTSIHRVVYKTFVGDIPLGMHIDHIDRDNLNNHITNLRCVLPDDNQANRRPRSKVYTEEDFKDIHF